MDELPKIIAILLTLAALLPHVTGEIPRQEVDAATAALRSRGYHLFGNSLAVSDLLFEVLTGKEFTFLSPPDSSVFSLGMAIDAFRYVHILRLHVIPRRLTVSDLRNLSVSGTPSAETLIRTHSLFFANRRREVSPGDLASVGGGAAATGAFDYVLVNGVRISSPDIYLGPHIAVHGLDGTLAADLLPPETLQGDLGLGFASPPAWSPSELLAPVPSSGNDQESALAPASPLVEAFSPDSRGTPIYPLPPFLRVPFPRSEGFADSPQSPFPKNEMAANSPQTPFPKSEMFGNSPQSPFPRGEMFADSPPTPFPNSDMFADSPPPPFPNRDMFADSPPHPFPRSEMFADTPPPAYPRSEVFSDSPPPPFPRSEVFSDSPPPPPPFPTSEMFSNSPPPPFPTSEMFSNSPPPPFPNSDMFVNSPLAPPTPTIPDSPRPPPPFPRSELFPDSPPPPPPFPKSEMFTDSPPPPFPKTEMFTGSPPPPFPKSEMFLDPPPPPFPKSETFGDSAPFPNSEVFADPPPPPFPNSEVFVDSPPPPYPKSDMFADSPPPPYLKSEMFADSPPPPFPKSKMFGDSPPFPKSKIFGDSPPFPKSKIFGDSPPFPKTKMFGYSPPPPFPKSKIFADSPPFPKSKTYAHSPPFPVASGSFTPINSPPSTPWNHQSNFKGAGQVSSSSRPTPVSTNFVKTLPPRQAPFTGPKIWEKKEPNHPWEMQNPIKNKDSAKHKKFNKKKCQKHHHKKHKGL